MIQNEWRNKDKRQYRHIKDSLVRDGEQNQTAKEIAARVVNKHRRLNEKTRNKTTMGTGNPNSRLEDRTRDELYNRAKQLNIKGRSRLNKAGLIDKIRNTQ
tara:strand:- start:222 stop:524 length:303 start_codon:yes stop_codon:yes gene_type:complete